MSEYSKVKTDLVDLGNTIIDLNKFISATTLDTMDEKGFCAIRIRMTIGSNIHYFKSYEEQEYFMKGLRTLCRRV